MYKLIKRTTRIIETLKDKIEDNEREGVKVFQSMNYHRIVLNNITVMIMIISIDILQFITRIYINSKRF